MASLNKVLLIGNLTRDPEIRYTPSGAALCRLSLAMNRRFTTSKGENRDESCFVDIDVWGKQAESCNSYLKKGSPAFVEGRLRFDQWDDRETGRKRSRLSVTAERVQFLGSPSRGSEYNDTSPDYYQSSTNTFAEPSDKEIKKFEDPSVSKPPPFPNEDSGLGSSGGGSISESDEKESMDDIPF